MDRHTLESAAAKYSYLRGLVGIPAGLALIAAALGNNAVGPFAHDWFFVARDRGARPRRARDHPLLQRNYGRLNLTSRQQVRGAIAS